ncbi:phosphoglycolate phosphatase [Ruminiclostridium hungatei]|uniref:Phosphoglycolate phosphatase n=1 Tax=Ruminiclostridium hungatei TaxID=48256 RepID=A0A1V4SKH3_RUMHU|nr:HAD family hydrolase [Ruminiclostridium hungatei]OPX44283.1 phosphoglycolate phosphatase [Ruminiclostridium hungatei]
MIFKAAIFDLDGTLIDSLEDLADSANAALAKHGFGSHPAIAYKKFVGNGVRQLIKRAAPAGTAEEEIDSILADYREIYNKNYVNKTRPYARIPEMLAMLEKLGIKMAVCSNKPHEPTAEIVEKVLGSGYFQVVFGEREGIPRKPDPAALAEAAAVMGVEPSEAIYLGDSGGDMVAAVRAGMYAAGALWGFREREELEAGGSQVLFEDPLQMVEFIRLHNFKE